MYFSLVLWVAILFFGYLFIRELRRKEWLGVVVNFLALISLGIAQTMEILHLSSREEIVAVGISLLAVLVADSYLILRNSEDRHEDERQLDAQVASASFDAAFALHSAGFQSELSTLESGAERHFLLGCWRDAQQLVLGGNLKEALHQFQRIDAKFPSVLCRLNIAALQLESGQAEAALVTLQSISENKPADWRLMYNRGLACYKLQRFRDAAQHFSQLQLDRVTNWKVSFYYAKTCRKLGEEHRSVALFKHASRLAPTEYMPLYYLGLCLSKLGMYEQALGYYDRALTLNGADASLWYNRGNVLIKLQDYTTAISSYDKAIERNPGYIMAWNNKGIAYTRLGHIDEAIKCYRRALSYDSRYHESLLNCALALDNVGQPDKALEYYSRFLQNATDALSDHLTIVKNRIAALSAERQSNRTISVHLEPKES